MQGTQLYFITIIINGFRIEMKETCTKQYVWTPSLPQIPGLIFDEIEFCLGRDLPKLAMKIQVAIPAKPLRCKHSFRLNKFIIAANACITSLKLSLIHI